MSIGTESFIAWVDYSAAEQERARQAIALFDEKDTRDELGIGSIRDALAEKLFPGTSTIQTRLRYFFFVPWIYSELEGSNRVNAANIANALRRRELELVPILKEAPDNDGTFGKTSGNALQRLPSDVYWFGLTRWGLFKPIQSRQEYHRSWDNLRARRWHERPADDSGVALARTETWNKGIPVPPLNFPQGLTFELTHQEAAFLKDTLLDTCRGSLLAHAATQRVITDSAFPWDVFEHLPSDLQNWLTLAKRFSLLMHGAAWVYNLALAEHSTFAAHRELIAEHRKHLAAWERHAREQSIGEWKLEDLWLALQGINAMPARSTREFVEQWQKIVRPAANGTLVASQEAFDLMRQRERRLKGERSRFSNATALQNWGGASGTSALNYRWYRTSRLLADLYAGLDREGD